jgi:hypothetical protein
MSPSISEKLFTPAQCQSGQATDLLWRKCISWRGRALLLTGLPITASFLQAEHDFVYNFAHCRTLRDIDDELHAYRNHPQRSRFMSAVLGLAISRTLVTRLSRKTLPRHAHFPEEAAVGS